jgi:YfiH family protein
MPTWEMHRTADGSRGLVCRRLSEEGLPHLFTLRPETDPAPADRRAIPAAVLESIGLRDFAVASPKQVHGARVAVPASPGPGTDPEEADAVVVDSGIGAAAIATADCVGAVLHAPEIGGFAVVHAGWRGTLAGVLAETVGALSRRTGVPASRMTVAMGPAIGRCCYEVGEDVADPFRRAFPELAWPGIFGARGGRTTLGLIEANRLIAERCGVPPERIFDSATCTSCRRDLCWSYRVEGPSAGRMWTLAGRAA